MGSSVLCLKAFAVQAPVQHSKLMRRGVARRPLRLIFLASSLGLLFRASPAWRDDSVAFVESARHGLGLGPGPDGFPTVGPLTGQSSRGVSEPSKGFEATWEEEESEETLWKSVTAFNAACWGATYISTKAGIDQLVAAGVALHPPWESFYLFIF